MPQKCIVCHQTRNIEELAKEALRFVDGLSKQGLIPTRPKFLDEALQLNLLDNPKKRFPKPERTWTYPSPEAPRTFLDDINDRR